MAENTTERRAAPAPRAVTDKGSETALVILEQAKNILSEEGFKALSFRRIAERCGISSSNVSYYYNTKEILLQELAKFIFERWNRRLYERIPPHINGSRETLLYSVEYMIKENKRPKTTIVLQEMWAMSNHSPAVMRMMDVFYGQMRRWIEDMLLAINPRQAPAMRYKRAALITAQIEGLMILIGPNRTPHLELRGLEEEAIAQVMRLAVLE